jgi:uncharacterized protein
VQPIVVDAGPLVAYFDRRDAVHADVVPWFEGAARRYRLLCPESVITEVTHMLDFNISLQADFVDWVDTSLELASPPRASYPELAHWMRTYANIPMDFADATVLWLYRANPGAAILTTDHRGFGVFRLPEDKRRKLNLVPLPKRKPHAQ